MKSVNSMTPINVGGPVMIPAADLGNTVGSFGWMRKELDKSHASKHRFNSRSSSCPNFKPGYTFKGFGDGWQSYDNITLEDKQILEALLEKYDKKTLLKKIAGDVALGALGAAPILGYMNLPDSYFEPSEDGIYTDKFREQDYQDYQDEVNSTVHLHDVKVAEVEDIINSILSKNGISRSELEIDPEYLVQCCEDEGFDLPIALAQLIWETKFGTSPRAKRTKSPFSIGSYDNGKDAVVYKTQNDAILPYIHIMKHDYLNNGEKNIEDILKDGAFINHNNHRYSSNPNYERNIRNTRDSLIQNHPAIEL